jgi:beta-phosphoglucomutase-like phosphatase (HAD superfamily)
MIKNIIFDFDGVILDSVKIKAEGYRELFMEFGEER